MLGWLYLLLKLGFAYRYATLFAGAPTVSKSVDPDQEEIDGQGFSKRLLAMLKKENFVKGETEGPRVLSCRTLTIP
jgi:hypothetical protein